MTANYNPRMSDAPAGLSKAILRAAALAARDALSGEHRAAAAQAVAERGLPFEIAHGAVVAGYSPIRSEIDPLPLMRSLPRKACNWRCRRSWRAASR